MKKIYLKKLKQKPVLQRHPWIFSGAIGKRDPDIDDGQVVCVCDFFGAELGYGYFNSRSQITVRMLSFGTEKIDRDFLRNLIIIAYNKRIKNPVLNNTNAFRVVYSEGDFLPGLIVDNYDGHIVIQILTLGIEKLRDILIELLIEILKPQSIYERSDHPGRLIEGIPERTGQVWGSTPDEVIIRENGMDFLVDIKKGQKTGFFLDQRENRELIKSISRDKRVLNLFCYTGGFTVAAALGGASEIISVDSSEGALQVARKNNILNKIEKAPVFLNADVFSFLRDESVNSDLIIIDPPSFTKSRESVKSACRGYKELNLQAAKKCPRESVILTCSCSRFIDMELFQKVIFSAMLDARRNATILKKSHHPVDHPVSIFNPEAEYLKSLLLFVD